MDLAYFSAKTWVHLPGCTPEAVLTSLAFQHLQLGRVRLEKESTTGTLILDPFHQTIVPLTWIEYGVYGDLITIYPKPYSIYLRVTIQSRLFLLTSVTHIENPYRLYRMTVSGKVGTNELRHDMILQLIHPFIAPCACNVAKLLRLGFMVFLK